MNLDFVLTDLSPFRTQKNTNIRSIRLTSNVLHDQLWQCLLCRHRASLRDPKRNQGGRT
jgi:hypothetical protein